MLPTYIPVHEIFNTKSTWLNLNHNFQFISSPNSPGGHCAAPENKNVTKLNQGDPCPTSADDYWIVRSGFQVDLWVVVSSILLVVRQNVLLVGSDFTCVWSESVFFWCLIRILFFLVFGQNILKRQTSSPLEVLWVACCQQVLLPWHFQYVLKLWKSELIWYITTSLHWYISR